MTNYDNGDSIISNENSFAILEIKKSSYNQNCHLDILYHSVSSRINRIVMIAHKWNTIKGGEQKQRISSRQRSIPLIKVWCVRETRRRQKTSARRSRHTVYWYVMRMDWELITRTLNRENVSISIRDCAGLAAISVLLHISFKRKKIDG